MDTFLSTPRGKDILNKEIEYQRHLRSARNRALKKIKDPRLREDYKLRLRFEAVDRMEKGSIQKEEFRHLLEDMCTPLSSLDSYFASIDKNGDGSITFDEFKIWFRNEKPSGKAFERFKMKFKKRMSLSSGTIDKMRARRSLYALYAKRRRKSILKRKSGGLKVQTRGRQEFEGRNLPETPQAVRQEVGEARRQWLNEGREIISESIKKLEELTEEKLEEDIKDENLELRKRLSEYQQLQHDLQHNSTSLENLKSPPGLEEFYEEQQERIKLESKHRTLQKQLSVLEQQQNERQEQIRQEKSNLERRVSELEEQNVQEQENTRLHQKRLSKLRDQHNVTMEKMRQEKSKLERRISEIAAEVVDQPLNLNLEEKLKTLESERRELENCIALHEERDREMEEKMKKVEKNSLDMAKKREEDKNYLEREIRKSFVEEEKEREMQKRLEDERRRDEETRLEMERHLEDEKQKRLHMERHLESEMKREEERRLEMERCFEDEKQKRLEMEKHLEEEKQKRLEMERYLEDEMEREEERRLEREMQRYLESERRNLQSRLSETVIDEKKEEEKERHDESFLENEKKSNKEQTHEMQGSMEKQLQDTSEREHRQESMDKQLQDTRQIIEGEHLNHTSKKQLQHTRQLLEREHLKHTELCRNEMERRERLMGQQQQQQQSSSSNEPLMTQIDILRVLLRQVSTTTNTTTKFSSPQNEKQKQLQEKLKTLRQENNDLRSFTISLETKIASSRSRTILLQEEIDDIKTKEKHTKEENQKRLQKIYTETKLAEMALNTLPSSSSSNNNNSTTFKHIRNDVEEILNRVQLRERIEKDAMRVFELQDLYNHTTVLDKMIRELHNTSINLKSRADMLERLQFDMSQSQRFQIAISSMARITWLVNQRRDLIKSCNLWNCLLRYTLDNMSFDDKMLMNHIEDIWEDNELRSGRTWRERRDEKGRILHFEDKMSWVRNRRESRLRFMKRYELNISK